MISRIAALMVIFVQLCRHHLPQRDDKAANSVLLINQWPVALPTVANRRQLNSIQFEWCHSQITWHNNKAANSKLVWNQHYSLIAFDKRVNFWLQCAQLLPCSCVFAALCAGVMVIQVDTKTVHKLSLSDILSIFCRGIQSLYSVRKPMLYSACGPTIWYWIKYVSNHRTSMYSSQTGLWFKPCHIT